MASSLLEEIAGTGKKDAYDNLPASIKGMWTRAEWLWLSDLEKARLVSRECVPDAYDD